MVPSRFLYLDRGQAIPVSVEPDRREVFRRLLIQWSQCQDPMLASPFELDVIEASQRGDVAGETARIASINDQISG